MAALPDRYASDIVQLGDDRTFVLYRAHDRRIDGEVGVHVLRRELAGWGARFEHGLSRTAFVVHPSVVPRHDVGRTLDGLPYVSFPLRMSSFAEYRSRAPSWDELLRRVSDVLRGLAWLHASGLVHGHLTPESLRIVDGDPRGSSAQIADLHASGLIDGIEGRTFPQGHTPYAAPEQRNDAPEAGERAVDLFALGAIVWEAVTGAPPVGSSPLFVPRMVVPAALEQWLTNLLQPNPFNRYDLAADALQELLSLNAAVNRREGTIGPAFVPRAERAEETFNDTTARGLTADEVLAIATWNRPLPRSFLPGAPPSVVDETPASPAVRVAREWPVVGRAPERELLWAGARRARSEPGPHVLLVVGPEGVGRARIVWQFVRALEEGGWAEFVWCAYRPGVADAGMAAAVRALVRSDVGDRAATVSRIRKRLLRERNAHWRQLTTDAEALGAWCGPALPRELPPPADLGQDELFRHLQARAWRGMSVLVLHDVHAAVAEDPLGVVERWMDQTTVGPAPFPLLVVLTTTEEALGSNEALAGRWRALGARGAHPVLVPPLTHDAIGALLRSLGPFDDAACARVATAAEGRPARAVDHVRAAAEQGLVDDGGSEWSLSADVQPDPSARWASHPDHRRLTDAAHLVALCGGAPLALVREWAGAHVDVLLAGPLVENMGFVTVARRSDETALMRAAASRPDVAYLRRRIAVRWAASHNHLDHGLRVVIHASGAGASAQTVQALLALSDRARLTECRPLVLRAATLAGVTGGVDRDRWGESVAALCRARAAAEQGQHAVAHELSEAARNGFASVGRRELALAAGLETGWADLMTEDLPAATAVFEPIARSDIPALAAEGLMGLALIEERRRQTDRALSTWESAAERAGRHTRLAARATAGRADLLRRLGRHDEAEGLFQASASGYRDTFDPLGELRAEIGLANTVRQHRPDEQVEQRLLEILQRAVTLAPIRDWASLWIDLGDLARHRGAPDAARARYSCAAPWVERAKSPELDERLELGRAQLALGAGDLEASYEHTKRASQALERLPGHHRWSTYRVVVASLLAARREHTETSQWLWSAQEVGVREWVDRDTAFALVALCDAAAEEGWGNVLRLAGQLGVQQLERLREPEQAARLQQRVAGALI